MEKKLIIYRPAVFDDIVVGDSIAINGVCLTIVALDSQSITFDLAPETWRQTNFCQCIAGDSVNVERAVPLNGRMGGHYVQGHIDCTGEILALQPDGDMALIVKISLPAILSRYIVKKGFIALDGMSLTVVEVNQAWFTVMLIPYTIGHTISQFYSKNRLINIEVDIMSKYIEKLLKND